MTTADNSLFLDTNVLLAATDPSRKLHPKAVQVLDGAGPPRRMHVSGQVIREALVVSTRPREVNGLGLSASAALHNVEIILRRCVLLDEDARVSQMLRTLVRENSVSGKQIHDANIAASMLVHGVRTLVTGNPAHFLRFRPAIRIRDLGDI